MGLEDVYVFDGGEVHLDSNATLGNASAEVREIQLVTLHVQDRGTFELHTVDKRLQFQMSTTNTTVSCTVVLSLQITVFSSPMHCVVPAAIGRGNMKKNIVSA